MNDYSIELPGLTAHHAGAAMATFGLYNFFNAPAVDKTMKHWSPCFINFKQNKGSFIPVLTSRKSKDQLVDVLCGFLKENVWDLKLEALLESCESPKISIDKYAKLHAANANWASCVGTDQHIDKNSIGKSPFWPFGRTDEPRKKIAKWKEALTRDGIWNTLFEGKWTKTDGSTGLFPEWIKGVAFRSKGEKPSGEPLLCLLSLLNWLNFPCFLQRGKVTTAGWRTDQQCFYYPVWDKPLTREMFVSWMTNLPIHANSYKRWISGWQKMGLLAIFKTKNLPAIPKKQEFLFLTPTLFNGKS